MQRSPKGLITIPHKVGWDWPKIAIGGDACRSRGQRPRRETNCRCPTTFHFGAEICGAALIEASGKNPAHYLATSEKDVLDRACAAARVLQQLDLVEI